MKKILGILSTFVLAGSTTIGLISTINTNQIKINVKSEQINWTTVRKNNSEYFNNLKKNTNQQVFSTTQRKYVDMNQVIDYAKEKTIEYIEKLRNKNIDSNQIIEFLSEQNNEFKENYKKILQEQNAIVNQQLKKNDKSNVISLNAQDDFVKLENLIKNLRINKTIFTTITATSAVAAAGFWAAAWWFGISVPWAVACTAISIASGAITTALNAALLTYDKELSNIDKTIITASMAFYLGHIFYRTASVVLVSGATTVTASSWAFPTALSLIPVISAILSWISLYK